MRKLILTLFVFLLIGVVFAEEIQTISGPIGEQFGLKQEDVLAHHITLDKENRKITFVEDVSQLRIGKNDYMNILNETEKREAYIKLNDKAEIIEADFTTNEKGGAYVIGNDRVYVPPNSRLLYKDGKVRIEAIENSEFKELPSLIDGKKQGNEIYIEGKNIEFPNENVLQQGELVSKNGEIYLSSKYRSMIDNIEISLSRFVNSEENNDIRIFFDGEKHDIDNYLSLNSNTKKIYMNFNEKLFSAPENEINLEFKKDNPFIKIETNDFFSIESDGSTDMELMIRNPDGKIPYLKVVKFISKSPFGDIITDGDYSFWLQRGSLNVVKIGRSDENDVEIRYDTTPILVEFEDKKLTGEGKVLLVDNNKGYIIIHQNNPSLNNYLSLNYQYGDDSIKTKEQLAVIKQIESKFPKIQFTDVDKVPALGLLSLQESLISLPNPVIRTIQAISLNHKEYPEQETYGFGVMGVASEIEGEIRTNAELISNHPEIIPHEAAHLYAFKLDSDFKHDNSKKIDTNIHKLIEEAVKRKLIDPDSSIGFGYKEGKIIASMGFSDEPAQISDELEKLKQKYEDVIVKDNFYYQWYKIQESSSYLSTAQIEKDKKLRNSWEDGSSGPKNGFIRPYGRTNIKEDTATFVEAIYTNPSIFRDLINPTSEKYDKKYRDKLELLYKHGFMTEEKYREVLSKGGLD